MKKKPIKIDWERLEDAFAGKNEDLLSYLDLVTGHVALEGEGEDDLDEDEGSYAPRAAPRDDPTRLEIRPPGSRRKKEWMRVFLDEEPGLDDEVAAALLRALSAEDPSEELGRILMQHPETGEAWYRYRAEKVRERIEEWLRTHEVEWVDPPPWKS